MAASASAASHWQPLGQARQPETKNWRYSYRNFDKIRNPHEKQHFKSDDSKLSLLAP
jgi:hypothetical protein